MNQQPLPIDNRIPIWKALSLFYLDTELQDSDFQGIAEEIGRSPYSLEEVKWIDKYEVFPVLKYNLLQVAGEWAGFEEDWLIETITLELQKESKFRGLRIELSYRLFQWMYKDYWEKLERAYYRIKP